MPGGSKMILHSGSHIVPDGLAKAIISEAILEGGRIGGSALRARDYAVVQGLVARGFLFQRGIGEFSVTDVGRDFAR